LSSEDAACSCTQLSFESDQGAARRAVTAAVVPAGVAHAGIACAKAVEVTKLSRRGSNHSVASGRRPPPKMAPRSLSETLTITALGSRSRAASASVGTRRMAIDEPAPSAGPSKVTTRVASSRRIE
jgi:hypothetical protein